jgi:wyosine [tRNA(Phe)-imidazoG37] synthetase (radical SAM superfamily)
MSHRHNLEAAYRRHERRWAGNEYVYAVVSRRSRGLSVGVNLNPQKDCNFRCVYCQVDRRGARTTRKVDLARLASEIDLVLAAERDGSLYAVPPFSAVAPDDRGVRDIAFSGDGEPTAYPRFGEAVQVAADARRRFGLRETRIVLITNSTRLMQPRVRAALRLMDENNGEVWAKLDAGTEEYFRLVDRPRVTLRHVLDNIVDAASARPIVIQTLWLRMGNLAPPSSEVEAYCDRLLEILDAGGRLKGIQLHTVARKPAEPEAQMLEDAGLDAVAARIRARVPVPVAVFYGVASGPSPGDGSAADKAATTADRRPA